MRRLRLAFALLVAPLVGCAHDECASHHAAVDVEPRRQTAHFERGVLLESQGRVVDAVVEHTASVDAGADDDESTFDDEGSAPREAREKSPADAM
jgi:hypothetical protein